MCDIKITYHGYNNSVYDVHKIVDACYTWEHIIHSKIRYMYLHIYLSSRNDC